MTLDEFWGHIQKSKRKDASAHADALVKRLAKLAPEEILDFDHWWGAMKSEAYLWDVWGAAYIVGGGCSDDGFIDFRSWLILQGRDTFQAVVADPDRLAALKLPARTRCECYPGMTAWFEANGMSRDNRDYDAWGAACAARHPVGRHTDKHDMGEDWDFDDETECRKRLPLLSKKYL